MFVINLPEYRDTAGDAALSYLAGHLGFDITDVEQLHDLTASADPDTLRAFIDSHIDLEHIAAWVGANEERIGQLRAIAGGDDGPSATLADTLRAIDALGGLSHEDVELVADFFAGAADAARPAGALARRDG